MKLYTESQYHLLIQRSKKDGILSQQGFCGLTTTSVSLFPSVNLDNGALEQKESFLMTSVMGILL